jgi:hypothetical protein
MRVFNEVQVQEQQCDANPTPRPSAATPQWYVSRHMKIRSGQWHEWLRNNLSITIMETLYESR